MDTNRNELPQDVCIAWYEMLPNNTNEHGELLAGSFARMWTKLAELHPEMMVAKDLLEALEAYQSIDLEQMKDFNGWLKERQIQARSAIAKARGEEGK